MNIKLHAGGLELLQHTYIYIYEKCHRKGAVKGKKKGKKNY